MKNARGYTNIAPALMTQFHPTFAKCWFSSHLSPACEGRTAPKCLKNVSRLSSVIRPAGGITFIALGSGRLGREGLIEGISAECSGPRSGIFVGSAGHRGGSVEGLKVI